jgi:exopolysaccharide biosynthesis polyprenyl glycosylphosphotransferase
MSRLKQMTHLWLPYLASDVLAVAVAYYTTVWLRIYSEWGAALFTRINVLLGVRSTGDVGEIRGWFYLASAPRIIFLLAASICILYAMMNLYSGRRFIKRRPVSWHILVANVMALSVFFAYWYLRRNTFHPRSFFVTLLLFNVFFCIVFRGLLGKLLSYVRQKKEANRCPVLLVGESKEADYIKRLIDSDHPHGLLITEQIGFEPEEPIDVLVGKICEAIRERHVEMVVLSDARLSIVQIMKILEVTGELGVAVKVLSDKMYVLQNQAKLSVDMVNSLPLVHFAEPSAGERSMLLRRVLSSICTVFLTLLMLPVLVLIAVLIKLTSRGPVLFVQERMGVNRKPFRMYKFRTMRECSEEAQAQLEEFNESGDGLFKIKDDPRVTWIGRLMRRFSLDELPQFFNVIKGDMIIVGPRPLPRRDFENYYEEWHYRRHVGMPGLTCLWQVSGRSEIDFHNMCILDVYYLRNRSWVLDLKIFLKTFWVVLFGRGAY